MSNSDRQTNAAQSQLEELIAAEWDFRMHENPIFATSCGDHRFDDKLPSVTEADFERRLAQARAFLGRLTALDRETVRPEDRLNYDILDRVLRDEVAELDFGVYYIPVTKMEGFAIGFPHLPEFAPFETAGDYANYIARLAGFETMVRQQIALMKAGLLNGYAPPRVAMTGVEDAVAAHIVDDPAESVFYKPFERLPASIGAAEGERLDEEVRAAIANSLVPGYRSFLAFLQDAYLPATREDVAASALPNGRAYYEHLVRKYTTLDVTPQHVHDVGLDEVRRIREEMDAVIKAIGFEGSFHDFVAFLRTDDRFYVQAPDALLKEAALILKKMDGELPRLFKTLPRMPYGIRPVPDYLAPGTTTAFYFPPTGDGTRAGFYYVNTYDLKSRPLYEMEALSLHEAVPGHHLQIALQYEMRDIPSFRRFGDITAFIEGWALYAERLGLEVGFYEDPYSDFGRLIYEMWRACRLVVDTGLHYLGWTRQEAIDYMAANTALTLLNIENEVDRYIAYPGQAIAYKMGELKIRQLRAHAERELGPAFDVRAFHDVILGHGPVPLDVLEALVQEWLAERSTKGRAE